MVILEVKLEAQKTVIFGELVDRLGPPATGAQEYCEILALEVFLLIATLANLYSIILSGLQHVH